MIASPFRSSAIIQITLFTVANFWVIALIPLLALEKNRLEGPPGFEYAFGDEFNGAELDQEIWGLGINEKNLQNKAVDCIYKMENISLEDGQLVFTQKKEPVPVKGRTWLDDKTFTYSSGGVHTKKGYELRNNMYLELRCKLPQNNGGYGAFWTIPRKLGDWKPEDLLEIDMFEFIAAPQKTRLWSGLWWHDFRANELHDGIPERSYVKRSDDHFLSASESIKHTMDMAIISRGMK